MWTLNMHPARKCWCLKILCNWNGTRKMGGTKVGIGLFKKEFKLEGKDLHQLNIPKKRKKEVVHMGDQSKQQHCIALDSLAVLYCFYPLLIRATN